MPAQPNYTYPTVNYTYPSSTNGSYYINTSMPIRPPPPSNTSNSSVYYNPYVGGYVTTGVWSVNGSIGKDYSNSRPINGSNNSFGMPPYMNPYQ